MSQMLAPLEATYLPSKAAQNEHFFDWKVEPREPLRTPKEARICPATNSQRIPMSKNPAKDFGPIADDYAFFETHATEAEHDSRAYAERLAGIVLPGATIRFLDFGCGSGTFTARFLQQANWPPDQLQLTLVEPVESARRQAVMRLSGYTEHRVVDSATLSGGSIGRFDIVLANHVLYYVPELQSQLAGLINSLSPAGAFVTAIASRRNALIEFWISGFRLLGKEIPYNTSEDVEASLRQLAAAYQKQSVAYELAFPDTEANRMRILRFLLAEHLADIPHRPLLDLFDRYADLGEISIQTASDHFTICCPLHPVNITF
jgi:trans-aconitate 2-methyltransferase